MTHLYATHDGRGAQVVRIEEDEIYGDYFYSELYRRPVISRPQYIGTPKGDSNYQRICKILGIKDADKDTVISLYDDDEVPL